MYKKYLDNQRQWRWSFVATNGKIIAVSSEAYHHEVDCDHAIYLMKNSASSPVHRG